MYSMNCMQLIQMSCVVFCSALTLSLPLLPLQHDEQVAFAVDLDILVVQITPALFVVPHTYESVSLDHHR